MINSTRPMLGTEAQSAHGRLFADSIEWPEFVPARGKRANRRKAKRSERANFRATIARGEWDTL